MKQFGETCDHDPGMMITYTLFRFWARCSFCDLRHVVGWRWEKRWRGNHKQGPILRLAQQQLTARGIGESVVTKDDEFVASVQMQLGNGTDPDTRFAPDLILAMRRRDEEGEVGRVVATLVRRFLDSTQRLG